MKALRKERAYTLVLSAIIVVLWPWLLVKVIKGFRQAKEVKATMTHLYKGQTIAVHVLDEHVIPPMPMPIPLGGKIADWEAYLTKCSEIIGTEYDQADIFRGAGYYVTIVEDVVGDQVLFRDSHGELRLAPGDQVITEEEAPKAFEAWEAWLSLKREEGKEN